MSLCNMGRRLSIISTRSIDFKVEILKFGHLVYTFQKLDDEIDEEDPHKDNELYIHNCYDF